MTPEPNTTAPGRSPTGTTAVTRLLTVSIAASEFGGARTATVAELDSSTATSTIATSSTAAPPAIKMPPRRRRATTRRGPRRTVRPSQDKRWVLREDRSLEIPELVTGLEPELVDQATARDAIRLERVSLPARAVQREHQLTPETFAQRMLTHQRLELAHQPRVIAQREVRVDPILQHDQPRFLQTCDLALRRIVS